MLPDMDGYTILSKIREVDKKIPVIIVSAKTDEISFVKGLKKGSDDYMSKPYSVLELIARVKTNIFYHRRRAFRRKRLWYRDDRYGCIRQTKISEQSTIISAWDTVVGCVFYGGNNISVFREM